jgi:hypothetical protein
MRWIRICTLLLLLPMTSAPCASTRAVVVYALPAHYQVSERGFTAFGNSSSSAADASPARDIELSLAEHLENAGIAVVPFFPGSEFTRKVAARKFLSAWTEKPLAGSSKKWLKAQLERAGADIAILLTTFEGGGDMNGGGQFSGFGYRNRKGALGIPDAGLAYAHVAVTILSIPDLRVLAHVDHNPCWLDLSREGFKGKMDRLTTEQLEWLRKMARVAANMHLSAALANAGLELLREEPQLCGSAAGAGDFMNAVYGRAPAHEPSLVPGLPFD